MTIPMGVRVRDRLTGFEGFATGYCKYLTGCTQILITADSLQKDEDKFRRENWVDEIYVEVVEDWTGRDLRDIAHRVGFEDPSGPRDCLPPRCGHLTPGAIRDIELEV